MIKELEPYFGEFNEDETIKTKKYPFNYTMRGSNYQPVIIIIYSKSIFSTNDSIQRA